jgi:hypothetical protein
MLRAKISTNHIAPYNETEWAGFFFHVGRTRALFFHLRWTGAGLCAQPVAKGLNRGIYHEPGYRPRRANLRALPVQAGSNRAAGGRSAVVAVAYGWPPRGWARPPPTRPHTGLERYFFHAGRTRDGGCAAVRAETISFFFSCGGFTRFSLLCTGFLRFHFGYCRQTKIKGRNNPYFNIR